MLWARYCPFAHLYDFALRDFLSEQTSALRAFIRVQYRQTRRHTLETDICGLPCWRAWCPLDRVFSSGDPFFDGPTPSVRFLLLQCNHKGDNCFEFQIDLFFFLPDIRHRSTPGPIRFPLACDSCWGLACWFGRLHGLRKLRFVPVELNIFLPVFALNLITILCILDGGRLVPAYAQPNNGGVYVYCLINYCERCFMLTDAKSNAFYIFMLSSEWPDILLHATKTYGLSRHASLEIASLRAAPRRVTPFRNTDDSTVQVRVHHAHTLEARHHPKQRVPGCVHANA